MNFKVMNKYVLSFGRDIHNHGYVSPNDWKHFTRNHITPRLSGYTELHCFGCWNDTKEDTIVVTIMYDLDVDYVIEKICNEYCTMFEQDCVMVEKSIAQVAFVG